jgi:uncharacterized membrane protein YvlD (DUF360 family)
MISNLFWQVIIAFLTLWLAVKFIGGVSFFGPLFPGSLNWEDIFRSLLFTAFLLGILNAFVRPILNIVSLPLRIITFNFFSFFIAAFLIWIVDLISPELTIKGLKALFLTTLILWLLNVVFYAKTV